MQQLGTCGQKQVYRRKSALQFGTLMYALWNQTAWSTSENPHLTGWVARICLQGRRLWFDSWVRKMCWRSDRLPTLVVHRTAKSWTRLSDFTFLFHPFQYSWAWLVAHLVKNPSAMWEIRTLDWEDPLEKGTATLSNILAWSG